MAHLLRPLLAVVVVLHVLLQPVAAIASTGWREDARCCCPDQRTCECPHGDHGNGADMLRRCGDAGELTLPSIARTVIPAPPAALLAVVRQPITVTDSPDEDPEDRWLEPETPPF